MKIIHFADLHLGVETYGRINPETGVSTRLEDFLRVLDQLVDFAMAEKVDLVLFCGDAYKNREPSPTQQREFARRISRLSQNGIPVFLLVGNHDLPNAIGKATATEIFDTLEVKSVYVSNRPEICRIETKSGVVQIATLPWLRRSALLSKEETKDLTFSQINEKIQESLTNIISLHASKVDPDLPAILAAHVWVSGSKVGSESLMTIGQEHSLLPGNMANLAFDYVALGHVHKHQEFPTSPPVVYAGSMDRVDFSEEKDEKGFYLVEIDAEKETGKRQVAYVFHAVDARRFVTVNVDVQPEDLDPTATVLRAISERKDKIEGAVVRLQISLPESAAAHLVDSEIRAALKDAYHCTISKDISREGRARLGQRAVEQLAPLDALKAYLEAKKVPPERSKTLLEYAQMLYTVEDKDAD